MKKGLPHLLSPACGVLGALSAYCFICMVGMPPERYPRFAVFCAVSLILSTVVVTVLTMVIIRLLCIGGDRHGTSVVRWLILEAAVAFLPGMAVWEWVFDWLRRVF